MYDHIGLKVKDIDASVRFYEAALHRWAMCCARADASGAGFGPPGEPALWLYPSAGPKSLKTPGVHIALCASSPAAVTGFYQGGIQAGGSDNGQPGLRTDYGPTYYAAFLIDPDGNNVEAVCLK